MRSTPLTDTHRLRRLLAAALGAVLAATIASLTLAAPATAVVYVEGSGEPAFTRSTTNTQWIRWQGSPSYATYKVEFDHYVNGTFSGMQSMNVGANSTGTSWVNWSGVVNQLVEGSTYGICAYGRYTIDGSIGSRDSGSCYDADQTGKRAFTTIDLTKPSIVVKIDGGAEWSKTGKLNYRIDYSDNLAFPFPANFLCRDIGTAPAQACANTTHQYNEACSVPVGGMKKSTYFDCNEDLSGANVADGPVTLCAVAADAAIPDNPNSSNQAGSATQANLSNRVCDSITIDRTAPAVSIGAAATEVFVGDLVNVTAQASDATSGLSGTYAWTWGDSPSEGTDAADAHTFTQPGTYQVRVKTTDRAGNEVAATKIITVKARPDTGTPGGGNTGGGNTGGGSSGGGDTGSGTSGGTTGGGTTGGTTGGGTSVGAAQTPSAPVTAGGGSQAAAAPGLAISAPKRLARSRKGGALTVTLRPGGAGRATLALVRGIRTHAQGAVVIDRAGTLRYRLKLPRRLPAGVYRLKVAWTPAGATAATTQTLKVTVAGARSARARAATARAASAAPQVAAEGAPVAVPTGKAPAAGRTRAVRLPLG